MYIHIGSNRMLRADDIVGIFDLDGQITPEDTKRLLRRIDSEGRAALAGDDLPRSAVLVCAKHRDGDDPADSIIYSRLTTQSLTKRAEG